LKLYKKRIFRFMPNNLQAMEEVELFFLPISKSLGPRVSGMDCNALKLRKNA
jgi:hypothetical protein